MLRKSVLRRLNASTSMIISRCGTKPWMCCTGITTWCRCRRARSHWRDPRRPRCRRSVLVPLWACSSTWRLPLLCWRSGLTSQAWSRISRLPAGRNRSCARRSPNIIRNCSRLRIRCFQALPLVVIRMGRIWLRRSRADRRVACGSDCCVALVAIRKLRHCLQVWEMFPLHW